MSESDNVWLENVRLENVRSENVSKEGFKNHEKIGKCLVEKRLVGKCLNRKMSELDGGLLQNVGI